MDFPYRSGHAFPLFLAPMSGVSESPFRLLMRPNTSCGNGNQSAVIPSRLVTARSATT